MLWLCRLWRSTVIPSHFSSLSPLAVAGREIMVVCRSTMSTSTKEERYIQKLLKKKQGGDKTRRKWYEAHIANPTDKVVKNLKANRGQARAEGTRHKQLGHVLYDRITDIINTGELSEELKEKQVIITSVKCHTNFQGVNVYWDANRDDSMEVEQMLSANSHKLRSMLINYHVLGRIPVITFVKSKSLNLQKLFDLMEIADYGPDYKPSGLQPKTKPWQKTTSDSLAQLPGETTQPVLNMTNYGDDGQEEAGVDQIQPSGMESSDAVREYFTSRGLVYHDNIYSLPHQDLVNKILARKSKTKIQDETTVPELGAASDFSMRLVELNRKKLRQEKKLRTNKIQLNVEDFLEVTESYSNSEGHFDFEEFVETDDDRVT